MMNYKETRERAIEILEDLNREFGIKVNDVKTFADHEKIFGHKIKDRKVMILSNFNKKNGMINVLYINENIKFNTIKENKEDCIETLVAQQYAYVIETYYKEKTIRARMLINKYIENLK